MNELFSIPPSIDPLEAARVRLAAAIKRRDELEQQPEPALIVDVRANNAEITAARAQVNLLENEAMERLKGAKSA